MAELKNLKVSFWNEEEKDAFIKQSKKYYEKRDDWYYFEYDEDTLEQRQAKFQQNWKEFLYVLGWIIACLLIVFVFYWGFTKKPEPIIKEITTVVTGNTYPVTIDTRKIPAIWSFVYFYDSTITVQKWAKLNQIRIDSDGIIRYNLCTQWTQGDDNCINWVDDKNNCDEMWCDRICTKYVIPYDQCFDTSIIWKTEQDLRDWICNK
jgi:hypothetical protein